MITEPAVILVVDDVEAKRYLLATWLRRAGHTIIEAATGGEALARIAEAELVVLDVNLPDMSGFEVCRQIKSDPRTAAIPVVQVSATAVAVADRTEGLTQGADAYLIEPAEPDELLATVVAMLRYYRARRRAELTATRLAALTGATLGINSAQTFDDLARAASSGAIAIFGAAAVVALVLPSGAVRKMSASPADPVPRSHRGKPGQIEVVARRVLAGGQGSAAVVITEQELASLVPGMILTGDVCVAMARTKADRPPVMVAVAAEAVAADEELQMIRQLTHSVALAVEALRSYAEEHLLALTLQRSFLPAVLPDVPGTEIAVRYVPATDRAEVGGDFYEALGWQGKTLLAIGDVEGHSLRAATVMGELRHALRAFASEGHPPLVMTELLNQYLQHYHPGVGATLCLALYDGASGRLQLINCGHLPVLVLGDQEASFAGEGGMMFGLPRHAPHCTEITVPPGGTVLFYTDGLVEDRKIPLDVNLAKLREASLGMRQADAGAFCDQVLSLFGPWEDDVALIALRRSG